MIRATRKVQQDVCPACKQPILITNWDDLAGVEVSTYRVDPTPLAVEQETVCIVIGRPTYLLEETIVRTWRLSKRYAGQRPTPTTPFTVAVVPHHLCGARFPAELDIGALTPIFTAATKPPF